MVVEGERLKALLAAARHQVVLCAPFMQAKVVETLLSVVADDVMVRLVTRWRAVEVAAGVSDLGIFEVANRRSRTELLLLNDLHAKLFVADERCLVGSANLTGAALGWSEFSNVELLVSVPVQNEDVAVLLEQLEGAEPATLAKRSEIEREAAALEAGTWAEGSPATVEDRSCGWLPRCAAPDRLIDIYENPDTPRVAGETRQDGLADLRDLSIRPGLSRERFVEAVAAALRRIPSIARILDEVPGVIRDNRGVELVEEVNPASSAGNAALQWRIVRDWIGVFFADEFEVAPESFVTRLKPR